MTAARSIEQGNKYPYDGGRRKGDVVANADDWAYRAARGILYDLSDRGGIKHELANVDIGVRIKIVEALAAIIKEASLSDKE